MDFNAIFQLRTKKFWWMDILFYFVISLLIATVLCYLIFLIKNGLQTQQIQNETAKLQTVGTDSQKQEEQEVITYQSKIGDFSNLLNSHEFASNVFVFIQAQTVPNIWYKQFNLDEKNNAVQLSGESDDMDAFSRQVAIFETNKYVKSVGTLNSALGNSARIQFNINLVLDKSIFDYIANASPAAETATLSGQTATQQSQTPATSQTTTTIPVATNSQTTTAIATTQQAANSTSGVKSNEKLITSFDFLSLSPQVQGLVDEAKYTVTLNVPYNTDVKNLTPTIVTSPNATVLPASDVSQDFESPVTYIVTAQDGSVQNYVVSVISAAPPVVSKKSNLALYIVLIIIALIIIAAAVIYFLFWKKMKGQKNSKPNILNAN